MPYRMVSVSCISSIFYIKPQPSSCNVGLVQVVYHPSSTSNHNCASPVMPASTVVYHPSSTSNHNSSVDAERCRVLYIIHLLHQTTTERDHYKNERSCISSIFYIKPQPCPSPWSAACCCISSIFYIKPQQLFDLIDRTQSCISSIFYIKPQLASQIAKNWAVVYHPSSTSNHNPITMFMFLIRLYIIHLLHQTTTRAGTKRVGDGCISSIFYIKPQPPRRNLVARHVVYHPSSTSNHNIYFVFRS